MTLLFPGPALRCAPPWPRQIATAVLLLGFTAAAHTQSLATAHTFARQGKADAAIAQARGVLTASPHNADAHNLLCLLFRSIDRFDEAVHECEAARDLNPGNSTVTLELARTYGAKADHAGALTGMRMVGRIRDNFEKAAQLDPKNVDALSDLGEFYVEAPGIVGGGLDKARSVEIQLRALSPERAHRLAGMIASKAGDTQSADTEFAAAINLTHSPESYVDLAVDKRKHKDWTAAEANAVLAIQKDTAHGPDTIDAAQVLIDIHRSGNIAEQGLRAYLTHEQVSAVVSGARVHTMLGELLQARGDTAGARDQLHQALALAGNYEPARKVLRP